MTKKELLKALKSSRKLYAYIKFNNDDGGYCQMVKSDFLITLLDMEDDIEFNAEVSEKSIYIG